LAALIVVIIFKLFIGLLLLLIVMQQALVLLLIIRRKLIEARHDSYYQQTKSSRHFDQGSKLRQKTKGLLFDKEDRGYFKVFLGISFFVAIFYFMTMSSVRFATIIGSFPFVLIAFGILLLLGNVIAFFSVLKHFNFHVFLLILAFIMGLLFEPHSVNLIKKKDPSRGFSNRQDLKTYFRLWINDPQRKRILDDPATTKYPVFFSLANGGASRSGYWVASVLAKLEDTTRGNFSKHLFCLSGASGGSVGNAAFFSLLRGKEGLRTFDKSDTANYKAVTDYLGSDFLTFTLARMLGPDVFRYILPIYFVKDRAAALARALETSSGKEDFLYDSLKVGFSQIITQKGDTANNLPVLCINATRMQDGSPAVFSTIDLKDSAFNGRVDVLGILDEKDDIKLSSAVVMGASFPYISPAGKLTTRVTTINSTTNAGHIRTEPQYFVDGGYFDNSGAGVVNEMITVLQDLVSSDTSLKKYAAKLDFYILHISNDPIRFDLLPDVNPLINDLAAPLKTLMGGYGSQTAVNDKRLKNYMRRLYRNNDHYIDINLYRKQETNHYSMNWVISAHLLAAMRQRLLNNESINGVLKLLR
jgi:predicted acylesterase/phospholipase RssA